MSDQSHLLLFLVLYLISILFSIALNLFSQLSRGSVRALEEFDSKTSERLEQWFDHPEEIRIPLRLTFLFSVVIFIVMACYNEGSLRNTLHLEQMQYFSVLFGFGLIYFAITEYVSHFLTLKSTVKVFNLVIPILVMVKFLLFPITYPLIWSCRHASVWRSRHATEEEVITAEDEIMSFVEQEEEQEGSHKTLDDDERRMIKGIFDLDETMVREIMTPRVDLIAINETSTFSEVIEKIKDTGLSHIPIYREKMDNITGILYAHDLLSYYGTEPAPAITEVARKVWFVPETKNIGDLLQEFIQSGMHTAIVLDEYGGVSGVVTIKDVMEEIIGEIHDAHSEETTQNNVEEEYIQNEDGSFDIDARANVEELNEELKLKLPTDPNVDTLAGLILNITGRIPAKDETVTIDGYELLMLEAEPQKIQKVRLTQVEKTKRDEESENE